MFIIDKFNVVFAGISMLVVAVQPLLSVTVTPLKFGHKLVGDAVVFPLDHK